MEEIVAVLTGLMFPILVWAALILALVCVVKDCMRDKSLDDLSLSLEDDYLSGLGESDCAAYPRHHTRQLDAEEENVWAP